MAVSPKYRELYERWRIADAKARAAEEDVTARLVNAIEERVHPPGVAVWDESKQLRSQADKLLREFVAAVDLERSRNGHADARGADSDSDHPRGT
jgi:hypothetical protein